LFIFHNIFFVNGRLTVTAPDQTISFAPLSAVSLGSAPLPLSASASSGLTVTFQVVSGPGSITGNLLTISGAGSIVIEADQAGNGSYNAAVPVQQSLLVYPPGINGLMVQLDYASLATTVQTLVGQVQVTNNFVTGTTAGVNLAAVNLASPPGNVAISAAVSLSSGTAAGLLARYGGSGDKNYYLGELVLIKNVPTAAIYRNVNGKLKLLASKPVGGTSGGTLELVVDGSRERAEWLAALLAAFRRVEIARMGYQG